jgi:ELMO/CED-12 family
VYYSSLLQGIEETKKMVISYDNLITRLWLNGAIEPFRYHPTAKTAHSSKRDETPVTVEPQIGDLLGGMDGAEKKSADGGPGTASAEDALETFINDEGLPPVPHEYWVERLGFQQPDPVTDFRSGGVLSLAMMVYMVESKPVICQRFFTGDTAVLPFGITCINVTDMIAKFLMLAKSTDRMDALLSQKPFWKMFGDPNAILAVQEIAMSMLCDVAVELGQEKKVPSLAKQYNDGMPGGNDKVCLDC